jgi:hypothetical protein
VGNAEAVQDAVQAVGELLIQRVLQLGNDRGVGVFTGWQDLVCHSGGGQLDDGLRWS